MKANLSSILPSSLVRSISWLAALALVATHAAAADVSLRVADATSAGALVEATVVVDGRTLHADADGRVTLRLGTPPPWTLEVRAPGYVDRAIEVGGDETAPLEIALVPRASFREHVDVVIPGEPAAPAADLPVRPTDVSNVAGGGENVFRALHTLPGVASPEDFSSRIAVRGGGPDENLTVMDGVEIHNPYRLFGLTSAFNPETVDSFELSAGGFGAAHGDRLSSLLVIRNREGTDRRALTGSTALGLTDGNLILEGRVPRASGSWLVTGRRTYYDLVAERFVDQDLPSFEDLQARTVLRLGGGRTLSLFGLRSREATDATFDIPEEGAEGALFTRTRNDLMAAALALPLGVRGLVRTTASVYTNTDVADFGGDFRDEKRRSNSPGDEAFGRSREEIRWQGRVRDHALRQELTLQAAKSHLLEGGLEVHRLQSRIGFEIPGTLDTFDAAGLRDQHLPGTFDSSRSDTRLGAWIQDRFVLSSRLTVQAGLRFDRSTVNARSYFAPRLSGTFALDRATRLRAAWGLYTQSPGHEKFVQADYFMDLAAPAARDLESERARHAILGLERDLPGGLFGRVEAYYKAFAHLIVGRLETPEETADRIAAYDFPDDLAHHVPQEPWITMTPTSDGRGRAYGVDVYLARRATSAATRLTGWATYTYGLTTREAYGLTFPADYDRRHAATVVSQLRLGSRWALSMTARVASGFPRTPVLGLRVSAVPDRFDGDGDGRREELVPERDAAGLLVYVTDVGGAAHRNTARLPRYERLDARLTWTPGGPRGRVQLYVDAINITNRKNAGILEPRLSYDPASDRPRIVEEPAGALPFLPSFGIRVSFDRPSRPGK
jgi:hypothetical protein